MPSLPPGVVIVNAKIDAPRTNQSPVVPSESRAMVVEKYTRQPRTTNNELETILRNSVIEIRAVIKNTAKHSLQNTGRKIQKAGLLEWSPKHRIINTVLSCRDSRSSASFMTTGATLESTLRMDCDLDLSRTDLWSKWKHLCFADLPWLKFVTLMEGKHLTQLL